MSDKMSDEKVALFARVRRRSRRVPDRGAARRSALVLLDRRAARARDAGRVPPRPVLEPGEPGRARSDDRPRDLAPDRRPRHALRRGHRHRRHDHRRRRATSKAQNPDVQIVGADPSGSVYSGGTGRPYLTEGVGEDFWPTTFDPIDRRPRRSKSATPTRSSMARRVTREEGLLIGGSGGTAVHAALDRRRVKQAPTTWSSCCCPTRVATTSRRSSTTSGCSTWASCAPRVPVAGDVLATKGQRHARPRADHARGAGARRDQAHARHRRVAARRAVSRRSCRSRPRK